MIGSTSVHGNVKYTTVTCDNAECKHGHRYTTEFRAPDGTADDSPHPIEDVRKSLEDFDWIRVGNSDLCGVCAPLWTPADGEPKRRPSPTPRKVGPGWTLHPRFTGPTKTTPPTLP